MSRIKITPFDASKFLDSEEVISAYLNEALASGDYAVFLSALGDVVKARGMTAVAQHAGLGRESLYKTLAARSKPRFETVQRITQALGVILVVTPAHGPMRSVHSKAAKKTETRHRASAHRREAATA